MQGLFLAGSFSRMEWNWSITGFGIEQLFFSTMIAEDKSSDSKTPM